MTEHWFLLALVLAFLSLDVSAVGQFMVSRPIVVGPLVGWLCGQPDLGLETGALVELIWIGEVAVGAHLPLDLLMLSGIATGFACELTRTTSSSPEAAMTYALGISIPLSMFSTEAEHFLRKLNVKWVHFAQRMAMDGHFRSFQWVNHLVLIEFFLKGLLTAGLGLLVTHCTAPFYRMLPAKVLEGFYYAHWLLLALGCSAVIDLLVEKKTGLILGLSIVAVGVTVFFHIQGAYLVSMVVFAGFLLTMFFAGREAAQ